MLGLGLGARLNDVPLSRAPCAPMNRAAAGRGPAARLESGSCCKVNSIVGQATEPPPKSGSAAAGLRQNRSEAVRINRLFPEMPSIASFREADLVGDLFA